MFCQFSGMRVYAYDHRSLNRKSNQVVLCQGQYSSHFVDTGISIYYMECELFVQKAVWSILLANTCA